LTIALLSNAAIFRGCLRVYLIGLLGFVYLPQTLGEGDRPGVVHVLIPVVLGLHAHGLELILQADNQLKGNLGPVRVDGRPRGAGRVGEEVLRAHWRRAPV
jgi:hypothetical protein